ncbi:MAG: LD-carboxypeptidase [Sphingomonadaceae bacterium]|nr:LD-carboxypeptidase [Sphingomonadaceae bacterium]
MTRIAICAPATAITREHADAARALVADEYPDLSLHFHEQCFTGLGHFAGSDINRLDAFLECANDVSYDAVWFAKGGYGSNRIAAEAVKKLGSAARNKAYVGFSDCGYMLGALYCAGIGQPVHGSMPVSARSERGKVAIRRVLDWFSGDNGGLEPSLDDHPTVAFNLMTLAMMAGTDLMPDLTGHVVMVEEVSEHLYAIDRLFFHLTSNLPPIAGLRLGAITAVPENDRPFGQEEEDIARFWCARAGIKYLGRAEVGHTGDNHVVPFGLARSFKQA